MLWWRITPHICKCRYKCKPDPQVEWEFHYLITSHVLTSMVYQIRGGETRSLVQDNQIQQQLLESVGISIVLLDLLKQIDKMFKDLKYRMFFSLCGNTKLKHLYISAAVLSVARVSSWWRGLWETRLILCSGVKSLWQAGWFPDFWLSSSTEKMSEQHANRNE